LFLELADFAMPPSNSRHTEAQLRWTLVRSKELLSNRDENCNFMGAFPVSETRGNDKLALRLFEKMAVLEENFPAETTTVSTPVSRLIAVTDNV
jgi:hypothetical protein